MPSWEFNVLVMDLDVGPLHKPNINDEWNKIGPDNYTWWNRLQQMGQDGWELVDTFPVTANGWSVQIVWTFKRQVAANGEVERAIS